MSAELRLKELIAGSHAGPVGFIGRAGYSLPDLVRLVRHDLPQGGPDEIGGLRISGRAGGGNVVYLPPGGLRRPATIEMSAGLRDACFVFDADLTMAPVISAHAAGQLAVFSGGIPSVGHGGKLSLTMFRRDQTFFWGKGSTSNGVGVQLCGDERFIAVGDDCMFAHGIEMRTHDMHALIDMSNGRQTNHPANITIEPHVWIGPHVSLGKGVVVGFGSVIGARSFVNRSIPRFCMAAGLPARVVRRGTSWDRKSEAEPDTFLRLAETAASVADRTTIPPELDPGPPAATGRRAMVGAEGFEPPTKAL